MPYWHRVACQDIGSVGTVIPSPAHEFVDRLVQIRDAAGQRAFISESDSPPSQELVDELTDRIRELLPKDPPLAEALAESSQELASRLDTPLAWGHAYQCRAYVFTNLKKAAEAQPYYEKAGRAFTEAGAMRELGPDAVRRVLQPHVSQRIRARPGAGCAGPETARGGRRRR